MEYKEKGMTLIEILISVAIMSILLAIGFWGYKDKGEELAFEKAIIEISSNIEEVREMALSAKQIGGVRPTGGYGVYFEKNKSSYIIFCDKNENKKYDGPTETEKTISLENISVINILPPRPDNAVDIVFIPPSPDIYVNSDKTASAEITFSGADKDRKIIINQAGVISIE
jgi:prepilin-type N-terminal cleavage/methylation domain-containing protein